MKISVYIAKEKKYKVRAVRIGTDLWMHVNGETWVIDQRPKPKKESRPSANAGAALGSHSGAAPDIDHGGGAAAAEAAEIRSPMPGKILKVNVKKGDQVAEQQVLVVMEAMKMEYSLAAPARGVVLDIHCNEGQQVEHNQVLVNVGPGV